jgi:hypothetical protein
MQQLHTKWKAGFLEVETRNDDANVREEPIRLNELVHSSSRFKSVA